MQCAVANQANTFFSRPMKSKTKFNRDIFPRLPQVSCYPALVTGCMFSHTSYQWHILPRLTPVTCLLALGTSCTFSHVWHRLLVFPRLAPVVFFPALGIGYIFLVEFDWFIALLIPFKIRLTSKNDQHQISPYSINT